MRMLGVRPRPAPQEANAARARISALRERRGWVPRVPDHVPRIGDDAAPGGGGPAGGVGSAGGQSKDGPPDGGVPDGASPDGGGRHRRPAGSAVSDRLPLPVRAVVAGLPAGVREGQFGLRPSHAAVVVLTLLLGLAVAALLAGLGRPQVSLVEPVEAVEPVVRPTVLATGTPLPGAGQPDHSQDTGPAELVVHVAGKVIEPGIVRLPPGSRVVDAVEAAGGVDGDVDLTPLNLARPLGDGEQILVGVDPPPGADPVTGGAAGEPGTGLVNLNTATPEQLQTLPGIGPALAGRIVQWREQNGRFTAVEELLEVSGIGPAKLEALIDQVTV